MALTKNQGVAKALIETMLRRTYSVTESESKTDVECGLKLLKVMLPPERLFILSPAQRFNDDFSRALCWSRDKVTHICHPDSVEILRGLENVNIVQLHTGMLNVRQKEIRTEIMQRINAYCRNVVIWHVGEWRV